MLAMLSTLAPGRPDASSRTVASRFRCRSFDRGSSADGTARLMNYSFLQTIISATSGHSAKCLLVDLSGIHPYDARSCW
jgi:hypothetical protein